NHLLNHWLPRQISLGSQWARVRHNGFRDLVQDIGALALIDTENATTRLARVLAKQYSNGYAPRTWLHGQILDKDFADNHVWIAATVHNLIMETGNVALLNHQIPFNDGSTASLYEHAKRAVDYLWADRGMFGLCHIRSGDWNDCLDEVGNKGKGVSVWLSMAWLWANQHLITLATLLQDGATVAQAKERATRMQTAINQHGWDGDYYMRAYTDEGEVLGSHKNKRGTLFLNMQTWAVIAGISPPTSLLNIMQIAEQQLQTNLGILSVANAYDSYDPTVGLMSRKTPGIQENGGVYLHATAFKLVADCMLKRHNAVEQGIAEMLPFSKTHQPDGEPYVFSNCY
ncbi:MAG: hypothetical protein KAG66_18625, partial [Methylococcales bacterium]|nr:hypothetical protein [Methylococcales bacterium]